MRTFSLFCLPIAVLAGTAISSPRSPSESLLAQQSNIPPLHMDSLKMVAAIATSIDSVLPIAKIQWTIDSTRMAEEEALAKQPRKEMSMEDLARLMDDVMLRTEDAKARRSLKRAKMYAAIIEKKPKLLAIVKRGKLPVETFTFQHVRASIALRAVLKKQKADSAGQDGNGYLKPILDADVDFVTEHLKEFEPLNSLASTLYAGQ